MNPVVGAVLSAQVEAMDTSDPGSDPALSLLAESLLCEEVLTVLTDLVGGGDQQSADNAADGADPGSAPRFITTNSPSGVASDLTAPSDVLQTNPSISNVGPSGEHKLLFPFAWWWMSSSVWCSFSVWSGNSGSRSNLHLCEILNFF